MDAKAAEIARCDREIAAMLADQNRDTQPAYLTTMGFEDWEAEKRIAQGGRLPQIGGKR